MDVLPISVGVLSWRSPKTVANTIRQYADFPRRFAEFKLFFQEISQEDRTMAETAGHDFLGRKANVGIQAGMRWVAENLTNEYMLYLENDFLLTVPVDEAVSEMTRALTWIKSGRVDLVRLRSRFNPGEPLVAPEKYSAVYEPVDIDPRFRLQKMLVKANPWLRYLRPFKSRRAAARAAYVERAPERIFPKIFQRDDEGLVTSSRYLNWTNNPVLIRRDLFLRLADYADAHPTHRLVNGFSDFERPLNCRWWRGQNLKIGLPDGIFTHQRIDR